MQINAVNDFKLLLHCSKLQGWSVSFVIACTLISDLFRELLFPVLGAKIGTRTTLVI